MKLKSIFIVIVILSFSTIAYGQETEASDRDRVGVTFASFSNNDVIYFGDVAGAGTFEGEDFFSIGINYIHPLQHWLELEAAVEYSEFTMEYNPPFYPGTDHAPYPVESSLLDIPVTFRANFLNYFYANSGVLLGIDLSDSNAIDNQSGLGGMVGIGAKYDFDFGASLFINPYLKMHSVLPFSQEGTIKQKVTESAVRIGITYHLN